MNEEYFVSGPEGTTGPFSENNLRKLLQNGRISRSDPCWQAGQFNNKKTLGEILDHLGPAPVALGQATVTRKAFKNKRREKANEIPILDIQAYDRFLSNKNLVKSWIGMLVAAFAAIAGISTFLVIIGSCFASKKEAFAASIWLIYPNYVFFSTLFFGGLRIRRLDENEFEVAPIVAEMLDILAKACALFFVFAAPSAGLLAFAYQKTDMANNSSLVPVLYGIAMVFLFFANAFITFILLKSLKEFTLVIFSIAANLSQVKKLLNERVK